MTCQCEAREFILDMEQKMSASIPCPDCRLDIGYIYEKFKGGGSLTDNQLKFFIKEIEPVVEKLQALGPHYYLPRKELMFLVEDFKGFLRTRKER